VPLGAPGEPTNFSVELTAIGTLELK